MFKREESIKRLFYRDINGILLLDKPKGMSSGFLLKIIKNMFCVRKIGHTGTLDPLATGMLPLCLGKATKLAKYFLNADKLYRVIAKLGESTNTFDSTGSVDGVFPIRFTAEQLEKCLSDFGGEFYQIPPMFSAVKYKGWPLYKYARRGMNIFREARRVCVYDLHLVEMKTDRITLDILCSKGTYIRSIINDLGVCLKCGAHVVDLRRLAVGNFYSESMVDLDFLGSIFYSDVLNEEKFLKKLEKLLIPISALKLMN